jgi:hypothetical protein
MAAGAFWRPFFFLSAGNVLGAGQRLQSNSMSDTNDGQFDDLIAKAEQVLTQNMGQAVKLGEIEQISEQRRRNLLLRCQVLEGPPVHQRL